MHGDRRPFPVALVTLDEEEIVPWAAEQGLAQDIASLAKEPKVIELVQAELDKANAKYAQVEQVKRFVILDHDLSQETGELTPTLKVKRNVVNEKYAASSSSEQRSYLMCAPIPPTTAACSSAGGPARGRSATPRCPSGAAAPAGAPMPRWRGSSWWS